MHRKRKKTVSDEPLERRIYEEAGKEEETFLVLRFRELLEGIPPPPGWRRQKRRGRPPTRRPGRREDFGWQAMVLVLLLKARHGLGYRAMSGHFRANPELCARLGLPRAPSASAIQRAHARLPEAWLKRLNRYLLQGGEKSRAGRGRSRPVWIRLD